MFKQLRSRNTLIVISVALVVAFVSAKPLAQLNALVAIPWGILAFLIAFLAKSKRDSLALGGIFGFVTSYAYLWFNDTSSYTLGKIIFLIFLIIIPSVFGSVCGLLAAWLGWTVKVKTTQRTVR